MYEPLKADLGDVMLVHTRNCLHRRASQFGGLSAGHERPEQSIWLTNGQLMNGRTVYLIGQRVLVCGPCRGQIHINPLSLLGAQTTLLRSPARVRSPRRTQRRTQRRTRQK